MLAAVVTLLTGAILLRTMGAILLLHLSRFAAACQYRSGQHEGRHGQ
jgi:hypothetical protein